MKFSSISRVATLGFFVACVPLVLLCAFSSALTKTQAFSQSDGTMLPGSIAEVRSMALNGSRQFVLVRGKDRTKPVLLFIHGGPGVDETPWFRHFNAELEDDFVVVYWVQRGAGKSFDIFADGSLVRPDIVYEDARQLADLLKAEFANKPIIVVGHSWGSRVGLELAFTRPNLVAAFVGIGLLTDLRRNEQESWKWTLEQANIAEDMTVVNDMKSLPDYPVKGEQGRTAFLQKNTYLTKFGGALHGHTDTNFFFERFSGAEYSWFDMPAFIAGMSTALIWLWDPLLDSESVFKSRAELKMPVYLLSGIHDRECPYRLAREYYEVLKAPQKRFVSFENSAHSPMFEEPELFNRFMVETVLSDYRKAHP